MLSTAQLEAMLEASKAREEEILRNRKNRNAQLSKEAFAKRFEEERADVEEPEPPAWQPPLETQKQPRNEIPEALERAASNKNETTAQNAGELNRNVVEAEVRMKCEEEFIEKQKELLRSHDSELAALRTSLQRKHLDEMTKLREQFRAAQDEEVSIIAVQQEQQHNAQLEEMKAQVNKLTTELLAAKTELDRQHQERETLLGQLSEAEAKLEAKTNLVAEVRAKHPISKQELEEVRTTIDMQERIVKVLEAENEKMLNEKKQLLAKIRHFEEGAQAAEAKVSLNTTQQQSASPTALDEKRWLTLEAELRLEIDVLKKDKKDLERRLAAVDVARVESAELDARTAKVELHRKVEQYEADMKDMVRKVAWYVEHQEFNRAQEDLIKQQEETIQQLRLKLMEAESLVSKSGVLRTDKDRQIRNLQRKVVELEDTLRTKNPNSIPELIRACRPTSKDTEVFKEQEEKIRKLEHLLDNRDKEAEATIHRLRVDADAMRVQYTSRVEKLEEEMKQRLLCTQTRKVKDLEKTLNDTRRFYTEKIREQDRIIQGLRRGAPQTTLKHSIAVGEKKREGRPEEKGNEISTRCSIGSQTTITSSAPDVARQVHSLMNQNAELKQQLQAQLDAFAQRVAVGETVPQSLYATSAGPASLLQSQLHASHEEIAMLRRLLQEAQEAHRQSHLQWEEKLYRQRQEEAREAASAREEHNSELFKLKQAFAAEKQLLLKSFEANEALHNDLLSSFHNGVGSKDVQRHLQAVAERLKALEHRQLQKEADSQRAIEEVKRIAEFEMAMEKQKMELLIQQKNHEIDQFRLQLDSLLSDLAQVRMTD